MPVRHQLARAKGSRLPAGTVVVDRRSRWGNAWRVEYDLVEGWTVLDPMGGYLRFAARREAAGYAVAEYRAALEADLDAVREVRLVLAGQDVACWCGLDWPCHGDVLLDVANRPLFRWCEAVA